ncbi:hypothetical protein MIND_00776700 [Mycena indigotica]|uniref:MYND-type domain-containing protein n=1 Tax=Mycena indigotica TaxID=2126181 RepID=A0A8H6W1I3_9AGAR|nr:uncharacterized protein MIND_00776700 [Mycena indigotica]KAF7302099.1 hypothetical protein MIND_00776700 [Mycena indigotica]
MSAAQPLALLDPRLTRHTTPSESTPPIATLIRRDLTTPIARSSAKRSIHDHDAFRWRASQIVEYIYQKLDSPEFCKFKRDRTALALFVRICFSMKVPRLTKLQVTHYATANKNDKEDIEASIAFEPEGELAYVSVAGRFKNTFFICDIYSALGFVIAETDPIRLPDVCISEDRLFLAMFRFVAAYCRWIYVLCGRAKDDEDTHKWKTRAIQSEQPPIQDTVLPNTVCVMYRPEPQHQTAASTGSQPPYVMLSFIGPNNGGRNPLKHSARSIRFNHISQLVNDQDLGLDVYRTPRELAGVSNSHLGECAEPFPLLVHASEINTPNGQTASPTQVYGMSLDARAGQHLAHFILTKVLLEFLKDTCVDCRFILHVAHEFGGDSLEYRDLAQHRIDQPLPPAFCYLCHACSRNRPGLLEFACKGCRVYFYCSSACRAQDQEHIPHCVSSSLCANCLTLKPNKTDTWLSCEECNKVDEHVPTLYCGEVCRASDREKHRAYCEDTTDKGPIPEICQLFWDAHLDS